jgi:cell division protease FtsH
MSPVPTKRRPRLIDVRTCTAYHEAGHAVLGAASRGVALRVSIRPDRRTLGRSRQRLAASPSSLAQVYLAGYAAEHLYTGRRSRALDAEIGLAVLRVIDPALVSGVAGIEACDGYGAVQEVLRSGVRPLEEEIRRELDRLYAAAMDSLAVERSSLDAVAAALLEREELDRREVGDLLGAVAIGPGNECP